MTATNGEAARRRHQLRRAERQRDAARDDVLRLVLHEVLHDPGDLDRHGLADRAWREDGHISFTGAFLAAAELIEARPELGKITAVEAYVRANLGSG